MVQDALAGPGGEWSIATAKAELEGNNEPGIDYDAQCAHLDNEGLTVIDPVW